MREHGPTVVLAAALLAFFGIRVASPDRPAAPAEARPDKADKQAKDRTAGAPAGRGDDHFWWPLAAFRRTSTEGPGSAKDEEEFEGVPVWPGFPDVEGWGLETLLVSVPDPVDSTCAYQFDSVVDAIQRGVETQGYVLDRYYYPWSGQKGQGEKPAALDLTLSGPLTGSGERRLTLKEGDKGRPFEREPGALLFRAPPAVKARGAAAFVGLAASPAPSGPLLGLSAPADRPRLLLVLLAGETATAGTHKEAFTAGLRLIGRSRRYRQTAHLRFLGPFYSGAQVSLAAAISRWADRELCAGGAPPAVRIVAGSATGVDPEAFTRGCLPARATFHATVTHQRELTKALLEYLGLATWGPDGRPVCKENVACLCESNTTMGRAASQALRGNAGGAGNEGHLTILPFPLHVSDVRAAHGGTGDNAFTLSLPSFGKNLRVPLEGGRPPRDAEPALDPAMAAVQSESVLTGLLTTLSRERFRYALVVTTDVKDRLFLGALVRRHSPETRLLFAGGDLLLGHPDFSSEFRGALVASPYPLHLLNQHWSFPYQGDERHLLFPSQDEQGYYNATVALLAPGRPADLLEYGAPFPRLYHADHLGRAVLPRRPPVWISIIGQGGPQPLAAVSTDPNDPYTLEAGDAPTEPAEFRLTSTGLWIVPTLGMALLLMAIARGYAELGGGGAAGARRSLWRPRGAGEWVYPLTCLVAVFVAYVYVAGVWSTPAWQKLRFGDASPVVMSWWHWFAPGAAIAFFLAFMVLVLWRPAAWALRPLRSAAWLDRLRPGDRALALLALYALRGQAPPAAPADSPAGVWPRRWRLWLSGRRRRALVPGLVRNCLRLRRRRLASGAWWWLRRHEAAVWLRRRWQWLTALVPLTAVAVYLGWKGQEGLPTAGAVAVILTLLALLRWGPARYRLALLALFLLTVVTLYLGRHWPPRSYPSDEVEKLFFFERATSLVSGVSPVVPLLLLGLAFFWWGWRHMNRLRLLEEHEVRPPFPAGTTFEKVRERAERAWGHLKSPHTAGGTWAPLVWLVLFFTFCRVAGRFVPSVEGTYYDSFVLLALALFAVLLVDAALHLIATWRAVADLLRALGGLRPLNEAFKRIPPEVTRLFGPYLSSERPGRETHKPLREQRRQRLAADLPEVRDWLQAVLGLDDVDTAKLAADLEGDLQTAARACLTVLSPSWGTPARRATLTDPLQGALSEWVAAAEEFAALEVVAYLSQFFVQLRNLLWFLSVGPLLMLFAVSSYPFQPQGLWLLFAGGLVAIVTGVVLWIITAMERDVVVSNVLDTDPEKINFHWMFLGNLLKYALPLLGVLVAASPDVSDLLHAWIDPVLRVIR